ncbi:MAG: hypothetical protein ABI746_10700 [Dermatophilaceae bacterium]
MVPTSAHVAVGGVLTVPLTSTALRPHTLASFGVEIGLAVPVVEADGADVIGVGSVVPLSRFVRLSTKPSTTMAATTTADAMTLFEAPVLSSSAGGTLLASLFVISAPSCRWGRD